VRVRFLATFGRENQRVEIAGFKRTICVHYLYTTFTTKVDQKSPKNKSGRSWIDLPEGLLALISFMAQAGFEPATLGL
jgi:hypothetical protein